MNQTQTAKFNASDMVGQLDYKQYDPSRPFQRFYRVGKWWKGELLKWQPADLGVMTSGANCTTCITIQCAGMPNDTPIGTLDVIWYLKFRRRTPAAYAG